MNSNDKATRKLIFRLDFVQTRFFLCVFFAFIALKTTGKTTGQTTRKTTGKTTSETTGKTTRVF